MISARTLPFFLCSLLLLSNCKTTEKLIPFNENKRWGFKDATGQVIIPAVYKSYHTPIDPTFIPVKGDKAWGVINNKGDTVIPFQYTSFSDELRDGMILVSRDKKYGCIDRKGTVVIPLVYDSYFWFSGNVTAVKRDGKYGMINRKGETVIPFEYEALHTTFTNGLAGARVNNKWGFIDSTNHMVIPFIYSEVEAFNEGLALVAGAKQKYGYINAKNDTVVPFIYDYPHYCDWETAAFKNGMAQVTQNGKSGYINTKGEIIIPLKYDCIKQFCDGFAPVSLGGKSSNPDYSNELFGYVDGSGKEYLVPSTRHVTIDWEVEKAPAILPDFTDSLGYYVPPPPPYDYFSMGVLDGVYVRENNPQLVTRTAAADSQATKAIPKRPPQRQKNWTPEKILNHSVNAFIQEPQTYPELCNLKEVSVACGILMCGGNYGGFRYDNRSGWEYFKKETLFKIIGAENLRETAWNWMAPYYKKAMQQMHPFHKQTYKDIAVYMKNYMNTYNRRQTENYLKRDEARFAHYDRHGKYDPYRKLSAFVDRLIIMHKVIDEDDARKWINRMADDVASW